MRGITRLYVATPPPVVLPWFPFILAGVLGPTVAVVAAAVPALLTTWITPVEAMQPRVPQEGSHSPRWLTGVGIVLVVVSGGWSRPPCRLAPPVAVGLLHGGLYRRGRAADPAGARPLGPCRESGF